jgi:NifU-like protein involved in Fe-S cluster formation
MIDKTKYQYSNEIISRFLKPKHSGKIKNPDSIGKVGNIKCGDVMYLYLRISKNKKNQEIIKDIKFQTLGCPAAIASSDALCEIVKKQTIEKAIDLQSKDIIKKLKNMPSIKIHCSLLGEEALTDALVNYFEKQKRAIPKKLELKYKKIKEKEKRLIKI